MIRKCAAPGSWFTKPNENNPACSSVTRAYLQALDTLGRRPVGDDEQRLFDALCAALERQYEDELHAILEALDAYEYEDPLDAAKRMRQECEDRDGEIAELNELVEDLQETLAAVAAGIVTHIEGEPPCKKPSPSIDLRGFRRS